ncbi:cupredoxin domain-containing protein [Halalkalibacter alkalisediminis]|uniref:Cupredoxin domain-containing protein n=1 Tax=Halalkalibacter alkalisediminis TaxID=935616 RepID=A0ABV6NJJ9_9BACI|nr:cupredoxin domain-containing protein [Halalkalibacter alkalisediminis]
MKFVVIRKKWLVLMVLGIMIGLYFYVLEPQATTVINQPNEKEFDIHMVTGEFKTKTDDGKELEAYRWDPGTIYIPKGQKVKLNIFGVNGKEHPFVIEGTDVSGTVRKGEETVLHLQFDEEGIYRLICTAHATVEDNGPMIAYIVVK